MAKAISAGLAKQEDFNQAPPIPPVETPTEPTAPFASAPSPVPSAPLPTGGGASLGDYSPAVASAEQEIAKGQKWAGAEAAAQGGQLPSQSTSAPGGRMPFRGELAKEPRKPELISTLAIEQAERPAAGPKLMSDSERTALEGQVKDLRKQFTQAASEEADRIQKMLDKDKAKRPYTEEQAAAESLKLKQEVWPEFDVRKFAVGEIPTQRTLTADDILAGYKQSSINPKLMEDPTIWRSLGITPLSPQERSELEASLSGAAQASSFAATKSDFLGGYGQLGLRMSDEEKQQAEKRLAIDDALKKGIPTTSLDDNPTASLLLHNRIITKKANDAYDGNVGRYMDITESRSIVPFLNEAEQQENKILSDIRSLEQVWSTQIAAGNKEVAEETLKTITKKKAEYTKLQADKQFSIDSQIRELSLSDDPNAKRKMQVLRAQKELAMMTDEEREKYALQKAVPGADTLRETVFKGMSDRDILRLTLHTKYLQYEQLLGSGIARGVNRLFDSEVEKLNEEIAILAPVVMLNKTPIKKIDEGFFSTAGKSVAAEFGGFGTERAKAERLNRVLQEADVMAGVAPAVSTGIEAAQDIGTWSKEAWGETTGTSLAFMAELIPTAVMTEAGLGAMRVPALVEKGANILKLVNAISGSRKALIGGRVLKGAYEAAKQGLSYELGGRIYDKKDEMNFLSGALGGLGGYVAGGAATRAASAIEKRIMATFGSAAPAVTQKVIDYGKRITAGGVRSIGQGVGETVEEFGEALGGIINESDSAQEILNGLKEQFPDASSVFHFSAQSFVMGSIMGQSNMIGNALWNRTKKLYASLNREERDMLDQLVQETNDVSEGVREELAKPVEEQAKAITPVGAPGSEMEWSGEQVTPKTTQQTPTTDAVQEPTTTEVGAQPSRTEGPREEGGGGVRPGVEGTEAAQAGGAQAEVVLEPTSSINAEERKQRQLDIINQSNPAPNDYSTWIRKIEDIKTAEEAFAASKEDGAMYSDFTEKDMQNALSSGEVTVYSSYPIKEGIFVSPSKINAQEYAGGRGGKIYSKKVKLEDIAWIDEGEGQFAPVKSEKEVVVSTSATKAAPAPALPQEIESLDDNQIVTLTYQSLDEIPDALRSKAKSIKSGGVEITTRKSILGIPVGKETKIKTPTKESYIVVASGAEIKQAAREQLAMTQPAAPAATTEAIAAPKAETMSTMEKLAKAEEKQNSTNKSVATKGRKAKEKMLAEDARLAEVNANFDKAVQELENAGKLKVRCP